MKSGETYVQRLTAAIEELPLSEEEKVSCRDMLAHDALDFLRSVFRSYGMLFPSADEDQSPLDEPSRGEWQTGDWSLHQRLEALASFAPTFNDRAFQAGDWKGGEIVSDQCTQMPWFSYDEKVSTFRQSIYDFGWVLGTDWMNWMQTAEAQRLSTDPAAIEVATVVQLAKVLTVSARRDRFMEGSFAADCESGLIKRVVQRAAVLLQQLEAKSDGSS